MAAKRRKQDLVENAIYSSESSETSDTKAKIAKTKQERQKKSNADFLLLKTAVSNYHKKDSLHRIVGLRILPRAESLVHSCGQKFQLDSIIDGNLRSQIENCPTFGVLETLLHEYLDDFKYNKFTKAFETDVESFAKKDNTAIHDTAYKIRLGFEQPTDNALGKNSLDAVLRTCKAILFQQLTVPGSTDFTIFNLGGTASTIFRVFYQEFWDTTGECVSNQDISDGLNEACHKMTRRTEEGNPDLSVKLQKGTEQGIVFTGEIKKSKIIPLYEKQTFIQSLRGLLDCDVTYGILYSTTAIHLYELRIKAARNTASQIGMLTTSQCHFPLAPQLGDTDDIGSINVGQVINFMKHICCIMAVNVMA